MAANTQGLATLQILNILENFRSAWHGFSIGRIDSYSGGGEAAGLRGPRTVLRRSALLEDPHRVAKFQSIRRRARETHSAGPHT